MTNDTEVVHDLLEWFVVQIRLSIKIVIILLCIILWTFKNTTEDFQ